MKSRPLYFILTLLLLTVFLSGCVSPFEMNEPVDPVVVSFEEEAVDAVSPESSKKDEPDIVDETQLVEEGDETAEMEDSHLDDE